MTLLAMVDYGLIVLFFIGVAGLIIVVARPQTSEKAEKAHEDIQSPPKSKEAYALFAALLLILATLTFFAQRDRS